MDAGQKVPTVQERLERDFAHPVISPLFDALTNADQLSPDDFAALQRLYLSLLISDHLNSTYVLGKATLRRRDHLKTLGTASVATPSGSAAAPGGGSSASSGGGGTTGKGKK